jgi:hypothetical protein
METSQQQTTVSASKRCGCVCHKMGGIFWVSIGVIFLLHAFDILKGNLVWIILGALAILGGLQSLFAGLCKCCDRASA